MTLLLWPLAAAFLSFYQSINHLIPRYKNVIYGAWLLLIISTYPGENATTLWQGQWFALNNIELNLHLQLDRLSWCMLILIGFISLIIDSFSQRYLQSDENQARFLGQLSLLIFSVSLLVISGNLLTAFIAWQLVGLCLYLLLNHYHYRLNANRAAKKKFIINRIGDMCFLVAVILSLYHYGSTEFTVLFEAARNTATPEPILTGILSLIFVAIMTKSAQFPFHIWLIDTMEAPTPVSALMHAGVINAGGFLLARLSPAYITQPELLTYIACVGLITLMVGVFYKSAQADTKRQLAYSTMSQMGYMALQAGLGCFISAVFHLMAHALYKAHAFLNSGSTLGPCKYHAQPVTLARPGLLTLLAAIITGSAWLTVYLLNFENQLNPVIWLLVTISIDSMLKKIFEHSVALKHRLIGIAAMLAVFIIYLSAVMSLAQWLEPPIVEQSNTILGFYLSGIILLALLIKSQYLTGSNHQRLAQTIYAAAINHQQIEKYYRKLIVTPVRQTGEILKKYWLLSSVLLLLSTLFAMQLYASNQLLFLGLVLTTALIVLCLWINRLSSLSTFLYGQVGVMVLTGCLLLAMQTDNRDALTLYYALNHLLLLGVALWLLQLAKNSRKYVSMRFNRLPISHFYIATCIFLLIGLPGTATFVVETALFLHWLPISPVIAVAFAVAMILLALTILHSLQVHFFNPKTCIPGNGPTDLRTLYFLAGHCREFFERHDANNIVNTITVEGAHMTHMKDIIAEALTYIPTSPPLQQFVAINPYADRTHDSIMQTAAGVGTLTGSDFLLPIHEYQQYYHDKTITEAHCQQAIAEFSQIRPNWSDRMTLFWLLTAIQPADEPTVSKAFKRLLIAENIQLSYDNNAAESLHQELITIINGYVCMTEKNWALDHQNDCLYAVWQSHCSQQHPAWAQAPFKDLKDEDQLIQALLAASNIPAYCHSTYILRILWLFKGWVGLSKWQRANPGRQIREIRPQDIILMWLSAEWLLQQEVTSLGSQALATLVERHELCQQHLLSAELLEADLKQWVWHRAFELSKHQSLLAEIEQQHAQAQNAKHHVDEDCHWVFCIDVRSEGIRHELEKLPGHQTHGYAGFFGVSCKLNTEKDSTEHCPVILNPQFTLNLTESIKSKLSSLSILPKQAKAAYAMSEIAKVEVLGFWSSFSLVTKTFCGQLANRLRTLIGHNKNDTLLSQLQHHDIFQDISVAQASEIAIGMLKTSGLADIKGNTVVICGHGSTTVNNPYQAAYDCGACGGNAGYLNAALLCQMLNNADVRTACAKAGIIIPADRVFVSAHHDTSCDKIIGIQANKHCQYNNKLT